MQQPKESGSSEGPAVTKSEYTPDDKYRDLFSASDRRNDLNRKAVRGGSAVMGAEIVSSLLRIGSMAVLARLLLPEDFGLLAMVTALTVFAERFKDMGLADATVQSGEINHEQVSNLFWINLSICVGIALIIASLSKAIAWFYHEPRLVAVSLVIASTFLFSGLVIQNQALLRRQLRFGTLALIQLCSTMLSLLVAIVLAYYGFGYWALVAREFSRAVFVVLGTWIGCPWRPGIPRRGVGLSHLLSFAKYLTGFNLIYFFSRSIDKILIGRMYGSLSVGFYTVAHQVLAMPLNQIRYPLGTIALPSLSALQAEPLEFCRFHKRMLQLLTFFAMPIVVFAALFADILVDLFIGPQWTKVVPLFRALAFGAFIEPVAFTIGPIMVATARTKEYFQLGIISTILRVICLGTGSLFGVIGVAFGYSVAIYLSVLVWLLYGVRLTPQKISTIVKAVVPAIICSLGTGLTLAFIRQHAGWVMPPYSLPLFLIFGVMIYLLFWLLVPGGRSLLREYLRYAAQMISSVKR